MLTNQFLKNMFITHVHRLRVVDQAQKQNIAEYTDRL